MFKKKSKEKSTGASAYPKQPAYPTQQSYPVQQQAPYPGGQYPGYNPPGAAPYGYPPPAGAPYPPQGVPGGAPYPPQGVPGGATQGPPPPYSQNPPPPQPAPVAVFDQSAAVNPNGQINIPPPPPGYAPTSAQLAYQQGGTVQVSQQKRDVWGGGSDGGMTIF